jgi:hypothetical protein
MAYPRTTSEPRGGTSPDAGPLTFGAHSRASDQPPCSVAGCYWPATADAGSPCSSPDGGAWSCAVLHHRTSLQFGDFRGFAGCTQHASLEDPVGLFNASLDAGTRRAIDLHEADTIDDDAFKALVRAAASLNASA